MPGDTDSDHATLSTKAAVTGPVIGHVHLRVSDLARSVAFYRDVLGFEVQQMYGDQAAFLSTGGSHHHLGLNTPRRAVIRDCSIRRSCIRIGPAWALPCGG